MSNQRHLNCHSVFDLQHFFWRIPRISISAYVNYLFLHEFSFGALSILIMFLKFPGVSITVLLAYLTKVYFNISCNFLLNNGHDEGWLVHKWWAVATGGGKDSILKPMSRSSLWDCAPGLWMQTCFQSLISYMGQKI